MAKYGKDGEFREPIVRCYACNRLVLVTVIHRLGLCPHCSNTRFTNVRTLNEVEMEKVQGWIDDKRCDPDWIAEFTAEDIDV